MQDRLALLPGWYSGSANATALDAGQYELTLTVAGSVDAFDSAAFEASLRTYLECAEPACSVIVHVVAASVRVTAEVTDTAEASVSAAARLTHMTVSELKAARVCREGRGTAAAPHCCLPSGQYVLRSGLLCPWFAAVARRMQGAPPEGRRRRGHLLHMPSASTQEALGVTVEGAVAIAGEAAALV